jgi:hypothetical protein
MVGGFACWILALFHATLALEAVQERAAAAGLDPSTPLAWHSTAKLLWYSFASVEFLAGAVAILWGLGGIGRPYRERKGRLRPPPLPVRPAATTPVATPSGEATA